MNTWKRWWKDNYYGDRLDAIRSIVRQIFTEIQSRPDNIEETNGDSSHEQTREDSQPTITDVEAVLGRFVRRILHHPAVLSSPASLQARLAFELQTFLLAHITHAEDSHRFRAQCGQAPAPSNGNGNGNGKASANGHGNTTNNPRHSTPPPPLQYRDPGRTFYHWVRSTSADHTSCPFSFVFFNGLVHAASKDKTTTTTTTTVLTASARAAYLAEDACRHLASLCRMYNDADEHALNSLNFPDFSSSSSFFPSGPGRKARHGGGGRSPTDELLRIADHERRGLETALELLEEEVGDPGLIGALRLFVRVTDLYGQIYVLQDVGKRTR